MSNWGALYDGQRWESTSITDGTSVGKTIAGHATNANEKGDWVEIIAATAFGASGLLISGRPFSAGIDHLLDIGVGAAASEQVIVPNLMLGSGTNRDHAMWYFPIHIPAGARIAGRSQGTTANDSCRVMVYLLGQGFAAAAPYSSVTTYGAATADSGGTSIDPGATANTKGGWIEIVAATTREHAGFVLGFGNQVNTARTSATVALDVAIGAAGSEQKILVDVFFQLDGGADNPRPSCTPFIPLHLPAGVRLAIQAASSTNDATDRLFDAAIYAVS